MREALSASMQPAGLAFTTGVSVSSVLAIMPNTGFANRGARPAAITYHYDDSARDLGEWETKDKKPYKEKAGCGFLLAATVVVACSQSLPLLRSCPAGIPGGVWTLYVRCGGG